MGVPNFIKIDLRNAPLCLTCPLVECVFMVEESDLRACPIYRREQDSRNAATRRWKQRRQERTAVYEQP